MKKLALTIIFALSFVLLQAHVGLDYPVGGEEFNPGQVITIQWEIIIPHDTQNWDLYFSDDGGATWDTIRLDIGLDTLSYDWTVPNDPTDQGRVKVVMDNSGTDYEDESGNFTITESSGISPVLPQREFSIFPNPASDFIYLKSNSPLNNYQLQIFNVRGKLMAEYQVLKTLSEDRHMVPLIGLKPGIYFISVRSNDKAIIKKIVKYRSF